MFSDSSNMKKVLFGAAALAGLALASYALTYSKKEEKKEEKKNETVVALIGDVGGTNVRLKLVKLDLTSRKVVQVIKDLTKIPSQEKASFEEAVREFLTVSSLEK